MAITDLTIFILGIYGLSWLITQSKIFYNFREFIYEYGNEFTEDLISCIVCTSVWVCAFFVFFYFPQELWFTKLLIIGTTTTTTWALAQLLNDLE